MQVLSVAAPFERSGPLRVEWLTETVAPDGIVTGPLMVVTESGRPQVRGFHPSAEHALARWIDMRRKVARERGWKNGPLFCTLDGGSVSDDYVRGMLRRRAQARRTACLRLMS